MSNSQWRNVKSTLLLLLVVIPSRWFDLIHYIFISLRLGMGYNENCIQGDLCQRWLFSRLQIIQRNDFRRHDLWINQWWMPLRQKGNAWASKMVISHWFTTSGWCIKCILWWPDPIVGVSTTTMIHHFPLMESHHPHGNVLVPSGRLPGRQDHSRMTLRVSCPQPFLCSWWFAFYCVFFPRIVTNH